MTEEKRRILASQFQLGATEEVQALVLEQDGLPFIDLRIYHRASSGHTTPTDKGICIPSSLLSELKRLVQRVEETLIAQGFSDEFENLEQLQEERGIIFVHPSEQEFAKLLDFYQIRWQYEPKTFPIQWDEQGNVLESFTPDFYLPDQDLYIELTTMKQRLVTKKNRKLRLFRQLYPAVNIKLFYGRDFQQLLRKYGIQEKKNDLGNRQAF